VSRTNVSCRCFWHRPFHQQGVYTITEFKSDLRPGGVWSSVGKGADGKPFHVGGEYLEIDPPRLLVQTWHPSWTGPMKTVVRWELEPQSVHALHPSGPKKAGTGTLVKLRHNGFAGNLPALTGHTEGWKRVLGWIVAYLERDETVESRKTAAS